MRIAAPPPYALWLVSLAGEATAADLALLDDAETARAARFVFERDRGRYVVAHAALRRLLGERLGVTPAGVRLEAGAFGKPRAAGAPRCAFSLSHSGDGALVALADEGEIGVDLEALVPVRDLPALARHCLAARELAALDATPAAGRDAAFLRAWTRKEACLKAIGTGLDVEPASFETGVDDGGRVVRIVSTVGTHEVEVSSFEPAPGWIGALARVLA